MRKRRGPEWAGILGDCGTGCASRCGTKADHNLHRAVDTAQSGTHCSIPGGRSLKLAADPHCYHVSIPSARSIDGPASDENCSSLPSSYSQVVSELGPIIDFEPPPMFREITLALREYLSLVSFASAKWCAPVPSRCCFVLSLQLMNAPVAALASTLFTTNGGCKC